MLYGNVSPVSRRRGARFTTGPATPFGEQSGATVPAHVGRRCRGRFVNIVHGPHMFISHGLLQCNLLTSRLTTPRWRRRRFGLRREPSLPRCRASRRAPGPTVQSVFITLTNFSLAGFGCRWSCFRPRCSTNSDIVTTRLGPSGEENRLTTRLGFPLSTPESVTGHRLAGGADPLWPHQSRHFAPSVRRRTPR